MRRILDVAVALAGALAALYMVRNGPQDPVFDLLPGGAVASAMYVVIAGVIAMFLFVCRRAGGVRGAMIRLPIYLVVASIVWVAMARADRIQLEQDGRAVASWPPRPEDSHASRLGTLSPQERVSWALRLAAHRLVATTVRPLPLTIPPTWPFPDDAKVGVRTLVDGRTEIWAQVADGTAGCMLIPAEPSRTAGSHADGPCIDRDAVASGVTFHSPIRRPDSISAPAPARAETPWLQYRMDAARSAHVTGAEAASDGWSASLDGPDRASASVVGNMVLVGAHHTGDFQAYDLATGRRQWAARLPNWVHQDAVSDGRIVVVGFGSDWGSFAGREPSGVAAFDLKSGEHLWTEFDESSVMTSPVVVDSTIVYASAAGIVRKRAIRSGALIAERRVPGGVIMGPPAALGDTLVLSLDANGVCAMLLSTLDTIWCRTVPGFRLVGHAAPTITNGQAIVSGAVLLRATGLREFRSLSDSLQRALIANIVGPAEIYSGQAFTAFRLRDGARLWTSRFFAATRSFKGHTSGTAVADGGTSVIVLPIADSLVAFRSSTGAVLWTAGAHASRGPPLIANRQVVLSGADGVIEVRDLSSGSLVCSTRRPVGSDRAGPTLARGLAIVVNLNGGVDAIPLRTLQACAEGKVGQ